MTQGPDKESRQSPRAGAVRDLGVGGFAGLVSGLLFAMLLKGGPLAILLYLLAPLPVLIVGLGWSHRAGLAAVVAGALALGLGVAPFLGVGFAVYLALPAWWLAYLALLGRPAPDGGGLEWYPLGRLLAWVAGTAALAFVAIAVIAAPDYPTFRKQLSGMATRVVETQLRGHLPPRPGPSPGQTSTQGPAQEPAQEPLPAQEPAPETSGSGAAPDLRTEVADALTALAPGLATQALTVLFVFYLWAAARVVQVSSRLVRPWPDIPATAMPRAALAVLAGALALALAPGYPGVLGVALAGAFAAAFALQGLAAFHDRSRGRPMRGALLGGLYAVLFLTQGAALVALTLFGIADTALNRRVPGSRPPSPTP